MDFPQDSHPQQRSGEAVVLSALCFMGEGLAEHGRALWQGSFNLISPAHCVRMILFPINPVLGPK